MKAQRTKEGSYKISKGILEFEIFPGKDRPYLPVKIKYDGIFYKVKQSLTETLKSFEECYSEEQVFNKLIELTT